MDALIMLAGAFMLAVWFALFAEFNPPWLGVLLRMGSALAAVMLVARATVLMGWI